MELSTGKVINLFQVVSIEDVCLPGKSDCSVRMSNGDVLYSNPSDGNKIKNYLLTLHQRSCGCNKR